MEYVTVLTPTGAQRLEIPADVVARGESAAYAANPPKNAVYIEALPPHKTRAVREAEKKAAAAKASKSPTPAEG